MTLANLAMALVGGLPFYETIRGQVVDPEVLDEVQKGQASSPGAAHAGPAILLEGIDRGLSGELLDLDTSFLGLGAAYMLMNTFFAAGVLGVAQRGERENVVPEFFAAGARNFPRFLRLLAGSALVYGLLLSFLGTRGLGLASLVPDTSSEKTIAFLSLGHAATLAVVLALVHLVIDYTRIALVVEPRAGVVASLGVAARFLAQRARGALGLYSALALTSIAGLFGFAAVDAALEPEGAALLLLSFLLQQVFIFYKIWVRATFFCAELEFFRARREA